MGNLCIIPARGGSKRLPGKNKKVFHNGNPIIYYPICAAQDSGLFDEIIVSSDDHEILNYAHNCGAHAIERPEHLCTDDSSEVNTYLHILEEQKSKPDYFCAIYPCAAFLTPEEINNAFTKMILYSADSCMGVTEFLSQHPYQAMTIESDGLLKLKFPGLNEQPVYPDMCASNGSLYWFDTESFIAQRTYFPQRLVGYETFSVDINTQDDFEVAQALFEKMNIKERFSECIGMKQ